MKLPFSFSLKFVFRLLFPGFVVSLALYPILKTITESLHPGLQADHILILSTILIGWLFMVLDMQIYMVLEGRRYWPEFLRKTFLKLEGKRLSRLLEKYEEARSEKQKDRTRYVEFSVDLRRFPLDSDGNQIVIYPTRLGNLLLSYEEYPLRTYGMDSIFYWYRIWVAIDDDLREQIDNQQALTDSSVYMTVSFFISGFFALVYVILHLFSIQLAGPTLDTKVLFLISGFSFLLSYFIYRSSLHLHAAFGELYKSLFDMYRDKIPLDEIIEHVATVTNSNSIKDLSTPEKYRAAWRYLHNYKIKSGDKIVPASKFINKKDRQDR